VSHIQPIAFLETWHFASTLYAKFKDRFVSSDTGMSILPLRNEEGALPILAEWRAAKALLSRIRTAASPLCEGQAGVLGTAALVQLDAGGFVPWAWEATEYARQYHRLHLCVVPSPGACVLAGGESGVLPVGMLTLVNRTVLHSYVNFGATPVIHLVCDIRKPDHDAE
jgi:hypothetical protein